MATTPTGWYDPTKLPAASLGSSADWLSSLNSLGGLTPFTNDTYTDDSHSTVAQSLTNYKAPDGSILSGDLSDYFGIGGMADPTNANIAAKYGLDPNATYATDSHDNPVLDHDTLAALYQIGSDGTATPVEAKSQYNPSGWVTARPFVEAAAAALGGGALAGADFGAGAGATGGLSSGDAAALYGDAGYTGTAAGTGAGTAAGSGAAADVGYMGPGSAGAGAGSDAVVNGSAGSSSFLGDALKGIGQGLAKNVVGTGSGSVNNVASQLGGGMSAGDMFRQQQLSQALQNGASQQPAQQAMPGWIPATVGK